ncbi:hypothetical protein FGO68_gene11417 [Halteria grandinella]|uniref:Uncharacterized protein n=1 Tax=Halteria grandinella TaxID=5974 RepID=A0A8J8P7Z1_HALGN|nr:hypothetical protein FGO68_gene11417 [Halteria grandinella]
MSDQILVANEKVFRCTYKQETIILEDEGIMKFNSPVISHCFIGQYLVIGRQGHGRIEIRPKDDLYNGVGSYKNAMSKLCQNSKSYTFDNIQPVKEHDTHFYGILTLKQNQKLLKSSVQRVPGKMYEHPTETLYKCLNRIQMYSQVDEVHVLIATTESIVIIDQFALQSIKQVTIDGGINQLYLMASFDLKKTPLGIHISKDGAINIRKMINGDFAASKIQQQINQCQIVGQIRIKGVKATKLLLQDRNNMLKVCSIKAL